MVGLYYVIRFPLILPIYFYTSCYEFKVRVRIKNTSIKSDHNAMILQPIW